MSNYIVHQEDTIQPECQYYHLPIMGCYRENKIVKASYVSTTLC